MLFLFRKFADIGNTVQLQYKQHLSSGWAELVTCHALPGPGVLRGLDGASGSGCGCVIVAEMSSEGTLATGEYTKGWPQFKCNYDSKLISKTVHTDSVHVPDCSIPPLFPMLQ